MNPATQEPSGMYLVVGLVVGLAIYAFAAFCFQKIAQRAGVPDGWWAWIPILNVLLMLKIADKPMWWIVLFFIPFVNFIIAILVLVAICQKLGKSGWLVVAFCIPVVNLIVLGYLAFGD